MGSASHTVQTAKHRSERCVTGRHISPPKVAGPHTSDANGNVNIVERTKVEERSALGIPSQQKFALKTLKQMNDQMAMQLSMLQRTIQGEHLVYIAVRPSHGVSQKFFLDTIDGLAVQITSQMQMQQKDMLASMQNGQREIVIRLNELNLENLSKIVAMNQNNLNALINAARGW